MARLRLLVGFFLVLGIACNGSADVYKWVDDAGSVHYGDAPPGELHSEPMQIRAGPPDLSDADESRRRRLLEQANRSMKEKQKRSSEEAEQHKELQKHKAVVDAECMRFRRQLDILQYQMPVYRDEEGKYRVRWQQDSYQGRREYIDQSTRARAMQQLRARIDSHCMHQNNAQAQRAAHMANYMSEKCEAARVELRALERPSARSTDDELDEKRRKVRVYCGR